MTESLPPPSPDTEKLRDSLVAVTLEWERVFGVAPSITSAVSEYDAACLVGWVVQTAKTQQRVVMHSCWEAKGLAHQAVVAKMRG